MIRESGHVPCTVSASLLCHGGTVSSALRGRDNIFYVLNAITRDNFNLVLSCTRLLIGT